MTGKQPARSAARRVGAKPSAKPAPAAAAGPPPARTAASAAPPNRALDLIIKAGECRSRDELFFHIVNRSVAVTPYDRASLWTLRGKPRVLAISGVDAPDQRTSFSAAWAEGLRNLKDREAPGVLTSRSFGKVEQWRRVAGKSGGLSALWAPLPERNVGALFERVGAGEGQGFTPAQAAELERLMTAYGRVWRQDRPRVGGWLWRSLFWLIFLAVAVGGLVAVRVPLRVVAPCEVTAKNPRLVSAPMDGIIDEVVAAPGQRVSAGDEIARYDSRMMEEELKISRRQVEVVEAELTSARARGFSDSRYRGEISVLEARLEQELARLEALETRFSRRVVTAPVDGMVQLDDARAWRGRPVSTGQAILWLVDPADTRLSLWLPQDDRIDFDMNRPISVHLLAMGGEAREARIVYMSSFAQAGPDGTYAFPAQAEWIGAGDSTPLGLRGSASIFGEEVSLGYWLFRRPLAWFRRWLDL